MKNYIKKIKGLLPNEKVFGSWDCDHWDLKVFLNTKWIDIVNNPLPYINAQWDTNSEVGKYFEPFKKYKFTEGSPF